MSEITFPRKKHSHRCRKCGQAVWCYKTQCAKPQRIDECMYCRPVVKPATECATYQPDYWR